MTKEQMPVKAEMMTTAGLTRPASTAAEPMIIPPTIPMVALTGGGNLQRQRRRQKLWMIHRQRQIQPRQCHCHKSCHIPHETDEAHNLPAVIIVLCCLKEQIQCHRQQNHKRRIIHHQHHTPLQQCRRRFIRAFCHL